ncbi:hypothetical protein TRIUR3_30963 [Triticum urartu]|uniref:Uncharacterized protein n=1 Tax=Triticum urartu TaxID=4572 RepID=M7YC37_TRIUA|nr:hypothetical protein TRIUR3_30963 [Triticum urartu]
MAWYLAKCTSTVVKLDIIGSWVFHVGSHTYIVEEFGHAKSKTKGPQAGSSKEAMVRREAAKGARDSGENVVLGHGRWRTQWTWRQGDEKAHGSVTRRTSGSTGWR